MANPDKMLLSKYVASIMTQMADAAAQVEAKYPQWRVQSCDLTARGVLKPMSDGSVMIDIDEPTKAAWSDIPIKMTRLPGVDS